MKKSFALNTDPHVADVGGTELSFQPEVMGEEFMDAYLLLRDAQKLLKTGKGEDETDLDPTSVRNANRALRTFLAELMVPESAELFSKVDVLKGGKVLESFPTRDAGEAYAAKVKGGGAKVVDSVRLPDRVLVELMEWTVDLYGGKSKRPPTSSSGSSKASRPPGTRGTAISPSKASTRARGR